MILNILLRIIKKLAVFIINFYSRALTPSMLVASHNNLSYNKINAISFSQEDEET
jgi:hypothetical protein